MEFLLTSQQCFYIGLIVFGLVGFIRGWRRELVSAAIILAGVLFLYLGFGNGLAQFFMVRVPQMFQLATGNAPSAPATKVTPFDMFLATVIAFVVIILLGYYIGNRAFPSKASASTPADRFLGIIPGVIVGFAVINYLNHLFANSPLITVGVNTPNQTIISNSILIIFLVLVGASIAGLVATRVKKSK